jgi:hypothetical protein
MSFTLEQHFPMLSGPRFSKHQMSET